MRRNIAALIALPVVYACGSPAPIASSVHQVSEAPEPPENGFIVFAGATCDRDESTSSTSCTRHRRIFSAPTTESASVQIAVDSATTCAPSAYSFSNPVTSTWNAGAEGNREFTLTTNAVSADCKLVLEFQNLTNLDAYTERQTTTITIVDTGGRGPTPTRQEYFISKTGNDGNDGLTAGTAWRWPSRADDVVASAAGHVLIRISGAGGGDYAADEHIRPANGGTDWNHAIKYCADGGDVTLTGTGLNLPVITLENGVGFVAVNWDCPVAADIISVDGGCTPVKDDESSGCDIGRSSTQVSGQDLRLCYDHTNTYGYAGYSIDNRTANRVVFCGNTGPHGAPDWDDAVDADWGDTIYFNQAVTAGQKFLIDGEYNPAGVIDLNLGGHVTIEGQGGSVTVRNARMHNDWSGVSSFSSPDGNRAAVFNSRTGQDWVVDNLLVNRTGKAPDSAYQESFKCEGKRTGIMNSAFRNPHAYFMLASSIDSSHYAEDCHVSHTVFQNGGSIALIEDYCDGIEGNRRIHGYRFKNNLGINVAQQWRPTYGRSLFVILSRCEDGYPLDENLVEVDGFAIEDRDCASIGIYIDHRAFSDWLTLAEAQTRFPAMFKNITCVSDLGLDNKPANGTDLTLAGMVAAYTPVRASEVTDTGVVLTTTNGSGSSSTSLAVHNGCWFDDPYWGSVTLNVAGVGNVTATAKSYTGTLGSSTACRADFTLSAPASWADGADVQFPFSGSAPDRGISH